MVSEVLGKIVSCDCYNSDGAGTVQRIQELRRDWPAVLVLRVHIYGASRVALEYSTENQNKNYGENQSEEQAKLVPEVSPAENFEV